MSLKPYRVFWSKAYYSCGEVVVLADSAENADDIVYAKIGDFEGNMQYYPDEDVIDVQEMDALEYSDWGGEIIEDG